MQERTSQWGKGKPIYSGDVLGNRMGKEERKGKASEKISRMYEANKQKENTARCKEGGFKVERRVLKRNSISISSAKGHAKNNARRRTT